MEKEKVILIQGAMEVEIETLKKEIKNIEKEVIEGYEFYKGELEGYPIVISKTEIGIMNSGVATLIGIKRFSPCMVINQGTAGGFGEMAHRGDIIIGEDCFHLNSYQTPYRKKGEGSNPFCWKLQTFYDGTDCFEKIEADKDLIHFIKKEEKKIWSKSVIYGTIGSGDCWNREMDRIEYFYKEYGALCEDMETLGMYQIAKRCHTPMIGIRVIADNEILQEDYDRTLASRSQDFAISLCREWIKEGKK